MRRGIEGRAGRALRPLCGEPGEHGGDRETQDARNNRKLIAALGATDRRAHYYCVMVLVRRPDDPEPLIAEGRWHGEVIDEARGSNGFGYDPYFFVPALGGPPPSSIPRRRTP